MKLSNYVKAAFGITIGYQLGMFVTRLITGCDRKVYVKVERRKVEKEKTVDNEENE